MYSGCVRRTGSALLFKSAVVNNPLPFSAQNYFCLFRPLDGICPTSSVKLHPKMNIENDKTTPRRPAGHWLSAVCPHPPRRLCATVLCFGPFFVCSVTFCLKSTFPVPLRMGCTTFVPHLPCVNRWKSTPVPLCTTFFKNVGWARHLKHRLSAIGYHGNSG